MTVSYTANGNYIQSPFTIVPPVSVEGGIIYTSKNESTDSKDNGGNKILDFKTGEYVDYGDYLLEGHSFDIKC